MDMNMQDVKMIILFNKYKQAYKEIKKRFDLINEELDKQLGKDNPIEHIKYRMKKEDSIINKMLKLCLPVTADNIEDRLHDIIGVRIVCSFLDDVVTIVDIINKMQDNGMLEILEIKDYISNPKENGYSSYHIIVSIPVKIDNDIIDVPAEIQVRTIAMDMAASLEHKLRYKRKYNTSIYDEDLCDTFAVSRKIDNDLNNCMLANKNNEDNNCCSLASVINDTDYEMLKLRYNEALKAVKEKLEKIPSRYEGDGKVNPIEHMKYRIKSKDAIVRKLMLEGKNINLTNIEKYVNDMAGIRLVCSFKSDLEEIKEFIQKEYKGCIVREKDYVNNPKESGYRGYHFTVLVPVTLLSGKFDVKVEIQVRTIAMEMWASLEQKICYHKEVSDDVKEDLKRMSDIISITDNNMDEIVMKARSNNNLVKVRKKIDT